MNFNIPVKEIIVNDDTQVQLLNNAGAAYADNDIVADTSGGFILQGFLNEVIWAHSAAVPAAARSGKSAYLRFATGSDMMIKTTVAAAVSEACAFTIVAAGGGKKGDTYRLVVDSLDLTPTEFQNRPVEKRYMLSVDCANAAAVIAELVVQINADPNAPVTAYAGWNNAATPTQNDSDKIGLLAKSAYAGCSVNLYVGSYADPNQTTYTVTSTRVAQSYGSPTGTIYHTSEDTALTLALGALPVNNYAALKNINWAKNVDLDRNLNWFPLPGASYTSYYFEVVTTVLGLQQGNLVNPNEVHGVQVYGVRLFVNNSSAPTLLTKMNLLEGDVG